MAKRRSAERVLTGNYSAKHKAKALFYFFAPIAVLSLGISMIDWYQGQPNGSGGYYAGWTMFLVGIGFMVMAYLTELDHIFFRPVWLFLLALFSEIYFGWWNLFWMLFSLSYYSDGHYFVNGVALANADFFGLCFWPFQTGCVVFISAMGFYVMIVLGILVPILIAALAPKDVSYTNRCERD